MDKSAGIAPVSAPERISLLDSLRGFALIGILLVNLVGFIGEPGPAAARLTEWGAGAAGAVQFGLEWLAVGKFYSLFSLLFGIGFAIQLGRLEARGEGIGSYVRRLIVLFGFGLAHMLLLWLGDILALYALVGLVLILFRRASDRALLIWALLLWLIPVVWSAAQEWGGLDPGGPIIAAALWTFEQVGLDASKGPMPIWTSPDYLVHLRAHLGEILFRYHDLIEQARPAKVLGMFLIGLWIGRRGIMADPARHRALLRRVLAAGLLVGLPVAAARAWMVRSGEPFSPVWQEVAYCVGTPVLALGYAAGFAFLWAGPAARPLGAFAPAGRMALTNYLGQTLILCLIFFGWGLGLIGRLNFGLLPAIALLILAVQLWYSRWWLERFSFGPAEWLWRTLTYGKAQPMRLAPATPRAAAAE